MQENEYQIEIDEEADAAYVRVGRASVARTVEVADGILVDFDARDEMVGVEVLGVRDRVGTGDRISYLNGLVAGLRLRPRTAAAE
jgi:uncharacterized protein YuzE